MDQLYGQKWRNQEGDRITEKRIGNGVIEKDSSYRFKTWCNKLNHLTDDQFKKGFERIEFNVKSSAAEGKESWPPSYAEFIGLCEDMPGYQAHKYFIPKLPVSDEIKSRRRSIGELEIEKMKSMFN